MCDKAKYDLLEGRVLALEETVRDMRTECQAGFTKLNNSVANLASEFGTRMNNLDAKIVEEKARWGEVLRRILLWGALTIFTMAALAAGLNIVKTFLTVK